MRRGLILYLGLAGLACNDDSTGASESAADSMDTDGTGDSGDGDSGDGDSGDGDSGDGDSGDGDSGDGDSGDGDSGDGDGDGPPFTPFDQSDWARGDIRIARVEVNQAIAIPIVLDGQLIPVEERTGGLVKDRNALVQAFWAVPGNWQPRPILAKLHVRNTEGQLDVLEVTKTISGTPQSGSLEGAITWQVPAGAFVGNLEFFIELWEGEAGHESIPASSESPSAPTGGMEPIGVTTEPMETKLILVPVKYDYGNCHTDTTSVVNSNVNAFGEWFFVQNPIHTLDISVHPETIQRATQVTTLSQINTTLVGMRFNDFAEPNEYYHAVLNSCSGGIDGAGGIAPGTPGPLKGLGDLRVSTSLWIDFGFTSDTIVHEVGHNQGRPHSPCGGPDGPDPNYPHTNAGIGVFGFNILTGQWLSPSNHKDYMSYCGPTWVSDWTWDWVHEQTRILTSWDYEGQSGDDGMTEILHGWVHPSGEQAWWTSPGELPDEMLTTAESIAFYDVDGVLVDELPAASWMLDDGKTNYYMAAVPDSDLDMVDHIVRVSKDVETVVPRSTITRYYDR